MQRDVDVAGLVRVIPLEDSDLCDDGRPNLLVITNH